MTIGAPGQAKQQEQSKLCGGLAALPLCLAPWLLLSACANPTGSSDDPVVTIHPVQPQEAQDPSAESDAPDAAVPGGTARIELTLGPNYPSAGSASYEVSLHGTIRVTGQLGMKAGASGGSAVVNLPAGSGYLLTITTTLADGTTACKSSTPFTVKSATTLAVPITLQCDDPDRSLPGNADSGTASDAGQSAPGRGGADARIDAAPGRTVPGLDPTAATTDASVASNAQAPKPDGTSATGTGAAAPGDPTESCDVCSQRWCASTGGIARGDDCYQAQGVARAGPASGSRRAKLCQDLMDCVHWTHCAQAGLGECYCGDSTTQPCNHESAAGACHAEIEAAGESTNVRDALRPDSHKSTVLSVAVRLVSCEAAFCASSCISTPP